MPSLRPACLLKSALLITLPGLLTGCSNMVTTASAPAPSLSATMTGKVHGGNQPIYNATVNLYSAGTTGYGIGSVLLATTTTDAYGSFSFTQNTGTGTNTGTTSSYYCPSGGSQLYLVGVGGNTLGTAVATVNNAASVLMSSVGKCSVSAQTFVFINEITTIATIAALQQYMNPGGNTPGSLTIGTNGDYTATTPVQAGIGLNNAFALVPNLINYNTGNANATFTQQNSTGNTQIQSTIVTGTPEQAKIITLANILAACVNQTSSTSDTHCSTLFTSAVPPNPAYTSQNGAGMTTAATFSTAVDTAQAGYYMLTNPINVAQPSTATGASTTNTNTSTTNLTALFNLTDSQSPFQTGLTTAPSDWTIGIQYSVNPAVNTATPATGTGTCNNGAFFIDSVYGNIAVDKNGNLFLGNSAASTAAVPANQAITEMSPTGLPIDCSDAVVTTANGGATIDQAGNVWQASGAKLVGTAGGIVKWIPGTSTTPMQINGAADVGQSIAADGGTHIVFNDTTTTVMYQLPITASAATTAAGLVSLGTSTASVPAIVIDKNNTVFAASGSTTYRYYLATAAGASTYSGSSSSISGSTYIKSATGLAIDAAGAVWTSNGASGAGASGTTGALPGNSIFQEVPTYSTTGAYSLTLAQSNQTGVSQAGLQTPRQIAIDGAGNVWTTDNNLNGNATPFYSVSQFTKMGAPLSPTQVNTPNGMTAGPTTNVNTGGYNKSSTYFNGPRGITVDLSGNVWITSTSGSTGPYFVTEIVGAGVPTIAPLSTQVKNNSFGTKP